MHFVNGQPSQQISIRDRGLLYGQSLFETIAVAGQKPLLLDLHLSRLARGCETLAIPFDHELLVSEVHSICQTNTDEAEPRVLRVAVTMGEGGRGYLNPSDAQAARILSLFDYPVHPAANWQQGIVLGLSDIKLAIQPALAGIKHGNRIEQTLIRASWQADWQEALVLDQNDCVIEATQSNVFVVKEGALKTPDLSGSGVSGVMRESLLELAQKLGIESTVMPLSLADIETADALLVSNSLIGLWPVHTFKLSSEIQFEFNDFSIPHKLLKELHANESIPTF